MVSERLSLEKAYHKQSWNSTKTLYVVEEVEEKTPYWKECMSVTQTGMKTVIVLKTM